MAKSNENTTGISPNLLKNFNPYELLEPQKINPIQIDKLIDIDEPVEATCSYKNTHVNASLLDQKPNYDLIDLYQNMYVTPLHVKVKENNDILGAIDDDNDINIDYNGFFDIVESGQRVDWSNIEKTRKNDAETSIKPKIVKRGLLNEDSIDPDDLIAEVLAEKSLEKIYSNNSIDDDKTIVNSTPKNEDLDVRKYPKIKFLKPPNIDLKTPNKKCNNVENPNTKCTVNKSVSKEVQTDIDLTEDFKHLNLNNGGSTDINKDNNVPQYNNNDGKIINTNFKVIAVKKDGKSLKKFYIATPESKKLNYTKGPDFKEKSIVLPQIMHNIINRQFYLEEKKNKNKKLILDFGGKGATDYKEKNGGKSPGINKCDSNFESVSVKSVSTENKCSCSCKKSNGHASTDASTFGRVSPTILMADCNKERLKAYRQSQIFRQFVMNDE